MLSVKKFLAYSAVGLIAAMSASTSAIAGGPDQMIMPAEPAFQPVVYIEGHLGYARVNWHDLSPTVINPPFDYFSDNENGGFTGGVDIGYQFYRYFAVEGGWFYLPVVHGNLDPYRRNQKDRDELGVRVTSWFVYLAAKLTVPVVDGFDLYGKIGVALRRVKYTIQYDRDNDYDLGGFGGSEIYFRPVFAVGGKYLFPGGWSISAQYMRVPGYLRVMAEPNRLSPAANVFTGAIGYEFPV